MDALRLLLAVALIASPLADAQPAPDPSTLGPVVNQGQQTVYPVAENESGEELTSEDVDIDVLVDVRNAEFDMVGVMLGGGSVETSIRVDVQVSIRAVNASRAEQALDAYFEERNVSASERTGINTSRSVLTADELRSAGGGVLLEAFQSYQEEATRSYLQDTLPQVTILTMGFDWQNTRPAQDPRNDTDPELREPPLVLQAQGRMHFLDRYSLADLLEDEGNASEAETPEDRLREQLLENQTTPIQRQSAFQVMGIGQLLSLNLPPGWMLNLTVEVPKGFTIAAATDALEVDEDRRKASYYVDGAGRETPLATSGVVKLSDRSLVTTTVSGLVVALGLLLRLPAEFAGLRWATGEGG